MKSKRRVDLLAVDRDANLVVIELKRTEDGGHMELQAVRYAAMVSPMTFTQAVEVYGHYLEQNGSTDDDIRRCVRPRPYFLESRKAKHVEFDLSKYDLTVDGNTLPHLTKRRLVFEVVKAALARGFPTEQIAAMLPPNKSISVEGVLTAEEFREKASKLQAKLGGK